MNVHTFSTRDREAHDTSLRAGFGLKVKGTGDESSPLNVVVVSAFGLSR